MSSARACLCAHGQPAKRGRLRNGPKSAATQHCMEAALNTPATRALTQDDLLAPFENALTPEPLWRVGTEAEKFGVLRESGEPIAYDGARGVRAVLDLLQTSCDR